MFRTRMFRLLLTMLAFGGATFGAEPAWPLLSGELAGTLKVPRLVGAPPLEWRVNARPGPRGPELEVIASAPGLALRIEANPPGGSSAGTWRVVSGTADAAVWWPLAATQWPGNFLPPDAVMTGALSFAGTGTWRGTVVAGAITVSLTDGSARSVAQGWSIKGIAIEGAFEFADGKITVRSARVRAELAQVAGLTARKILLEAEGASGGRFSVRRAEVGVMGGRVALAPFTLDPAAPAVHTDAEIVGIALSDLAALVPQALAEARGQVAGRVSVNWSLSGGVEPGTGLLSVSADAPAGLRLTNSPGLLTGSATPRIEFLPAWTGPLRRWLSVENPAYDVLRRIERGELPLVVENLQVKLYPDGLTAPQSVRVELAAHPTAGSAVQRVTFAVNVTGPLMEVLKLGLDDRAKILVNAPK